MASHFTFSRKSNIIKLSSKEYIPDNILDEQVKTYINPLNVCLHAMFQAKYLICENFITPCPRMYHMAGIFMVFFAGATQYHSFDFIMGPNHESYFLVIAPFMHWISCCITTISLLVDNILNADVNIELVLNIQAARKAFKCDKEMKIPTIGIRFFIGMITLNIFGSLLSICREWRDIGVFVSSLVMFFYDITIAYAYGVVKLLRVNILIWLVELKMRDVKSSNRAMETRFSSNWHELEVSFENLCKAFYGCQKSLSVPVLLFVLTVFASALMVMQIIIEFDKVDVTFYNVIAPIIGSLSYICKNLLLLTLLCGECEKLYDAIGAIHTECLCMIGKHTIPEDQRRVVKNVMRLVACLARKIAPWSMFELDAALLLHFGHLVTTHLIVLLQFAYLNKE